MLLYPLATSMMISSEPLLNLLHRTITESKSKSLDVIFSAPKKLRYQSLCVVALLVKSCADFKLKVTPILEYNIIISYYSHTCSGQNDQFPLPPSPLAPTNLLGTPPLIHVTSEILSRLVKIYGWKLITKTAAPLPPHQTHLKMYDVMLCHASWDVTSHTLMHTRPPNSGESLNHCFCQTSVVHDFGCEFYCSHAKTVKICLSPLLSLVISWSLRWNLSWVH